MRFLADMGVSQRVVAWLRAEHHDAIHLRDEDLQSLPDDEIFLKALRERRAVLTFDLDFGEIVAGCGRETVSVILFRLRNTRTDFVIERLRTVLDASANLLQAGAIIIVEDGRTRVRKLPLGQ